MTDVSMAEFNNSQDQQQVVAAGGFGEWVFLWNLIVTMEINSIKNCNHGKILKFTARSRTMLPPSPSTTTSPPTSFPQKRGRYDDQHEIDSSLLSNEDDEIISNMIMMSSLRRRKRLLLSQQQQNTFQNEHIFDNVVKLVEDKIYD